MPRFIRLARVDEVRARGAMELEWDGRIIALIAEGDQIRAIDGICPHQGGPLAEGERRDGVVTCPWHGWRFDLRDGRCLTGRTVRQPVYAVRIEDGDVLVDVG
jgi:nitrite reductase/ring-hydroxylating ferredoxin subunit